MEDLAAIFMVQSQDNTQSSDGASLTTRYCLELLRGKSQGVSCDDAICGIILMFPSG